MIGRLIGQVMGVENGVATLMTDVGVGYEVETTQHPVDGVRVGLFIHTHVTDSNIALFGFESSELRRRFRTLIGIKGIGPKAALALCRIPDAEFARVIKACDVNALRAVKGIGAETAKRIILSSRPTWNPS